MWLLLLVSYLKNCCQDLYQRDYYLYFLLGVSWFWISVQVSNLYWVSFCVMVKFHSLQVVVQFSRHHYLRLSFPSIFLPPLSYINWLYMCGFISGVPIICHMFLVLQNKTYVFGFTLRQYCFIIVLQYSLKSGRVMLSGLFFLSRLLWFFKIFNDFLQILGLFLSLPWKMPLKFW